MFLLPPLCFYLYEKLSVYIYFTLLKQENEHTKWRHRANTNRKGDDKMYVTVTA